VPVVVPAVAPAVVPCSAAEIYRRLRGTCCLHHQGNDFSVFVIK
jgi:hypothetical protein